MKKRVLMILFAISLSCTAVMPVYADEGVEYSGTQAENPTKTLSTGEIVDIVTGDVVGYDSSQPDAGMNISGTVTPTPGEGMEGTEESEKERAELLEEAYNGSEETNTEKKETSEKNSDEKTSGKIVRKEVYDALDEDAEEALVKLVQESDTPYTLSVDEQAIDLTLDFDTVKALKAAGKEFYVQMVKRSDTATSGSYSWHFTKDALNKMEDKEVNLAASVYDNAAYDDAKTINFASEENPAQFVYFVKSTNETYGIYKKDASEKIADVKADKSGKVEFSVPAESVILSTADVVAESKVKHADKTTAEELAEKKETESYREEAKTPTAMYLLMVLGGVLIGAFLVFLGFKVKNAGGKEPSAMEMVNEEVEICGKEENEVSGNENDFREESDAAEADMVTERCEESHDPTSNEETVAEGAARDNMDKETLPEETEPSIEQTKPEKEELEDEKDETLDI